VFLATEVLARDRLERYETAEVVDRPSGVKVIPPFALYSLGPRVLTGQFIKSMLRLHS
jgi:hypothetical protein